jgi:hypothetical protein
MAVALAVCISGPAWADTNVETDDAIDYTLPGPIWCLATDTGLVHTSGCTTTIGSANDYTTEPGPTIGDGALGGADVDLYKFTVLSVPAVLIVNCTRDFVTGSPGEDAGALDPYVILWDDSTCGPPGGPHPGPVAESDDTPGNGCLGQDTHWIYSLQNTGVYYLGVSSLVGDGSVPPDYAACECGTQGLNYSDGDYDLDITVCSQGTATGAEEENDTIIEADIKGDMTPGVPIDGNIGNGKWGASSGDYDWYRFNVTIPCSLISARCQTDTIGSDLDAVVNIYDASCQILNQAIHFDPHPGDGMQDCPGDTICEWIVANAGWYYVEIHGNGTGSQGDACADAAAGNGAGSTGNYRLTVTQTAPGSYPSPADITEPNDWAAVAIPVPLTDCTGCWVKEDMFIGDGPCGCIPGNDTVGGDFDVYAITLPPGCEVLVCLQTTDRPEADSQADLAITVWPADLPLLDDFLIFGLGDPMCNAQCMWFCNPKDTPGSNNLYYICVGGIDVPSTLQPDPSCLDTAKNGVTGVGYYDIYVELTPYLGWCQPSAWVDLCAELGCSEANRAYILRSFYNICDPDDPNDPDNFDTEIADDFYVPEGKIWRLCDIHAHWRAIFGDPTTSTVPMEMQFRIYEGWRAGCLHNPPTRTHMVPDQLIWEYVVTGFVECSKRYSRGLVNAFANSTKYTPDHKCEDSCAPDAFIELGEGTYWVSMVMSHAPGDIGNNAHGWVESNRPTSPCFTPSNGEDAQWLFAAGWAAASPPPSCGTDWESVLEHFQQAAIGDCDFDMALKLSGEEIDACCPCVGDLSEPCDNVRNVTDFTIFAAAYGSSCGDPNYNECADFDDNCVVNVTDFTVFATGFGVPCP